MTDESGEYDMSKLRSERRSQLSVPVSWSIVIAIIGAAVTWGMTSQRVTYVESQQAQEAIYRSDQEKHMAAQDTEIAVVKAQYTEIIRRLVDIEGRLERIDQTQQRRQ